MNFKNLTQIVDVRNSLTRHRTKRFPVVGVNQKEDIAIHHSLTKLESRGSNAEGYANFHVHSHGWPGIGYHFVIEKDGTIKWCNDLSLRSYHVGNFNNQSVGICLSGDFRVEQPTEKQKTSLNMLVNALKTDLPNYKRTLGHSDYPGYEWKQCPVFDWRTILENKKVKKPQTSNTHVIKKGDTLWKIAVNNQLTVSNILSLNPELDPLKLQPGQVIYLKKKANEHTETDEKSVTSEILPNRPQQNLKQKVIGHTTVLVPFLNRRAEASFSSKITGTVRKGQRLNVYGTKNGLYDLGSLDWVSAGSRYTKFEPVSNSSVQTNSTVQLPTGILRRGDRGFRVKQLQVGLNAVNFKVGAVDGIYGSKTEAGVRRFQSVYLPNEIDGVYGSNTRAEMLKKL